MSACARTRVMFTSLVVAVALLLGAPGGATAQTFYDRGSFEVGGAPVTEDLSSYASGSTVTDLFDGQLVIGTPLTIVSGTWGGPVQGHALQGATSWVISFPTPVHGFGADFWDDINGTEAAISITALTSGGGFVINDLVAAEGYNGFLGVAGVDVQILFFSAPEPFYLDNLTILDLPPLNHFERSTFEAIGTPEMEDFDAFAHGTPIANLFGSLVTTGVPQPTAWVDTWPGGQPVQGSALVVETRGDPARKITMSFSNPVRGIGADMYGGGAGQILLTATTTDGQTGMVPWFGSSGYNGFRGLTARQGFTQLEITDLSGGTADIFIDNLTLIGVPAEPPVAYSNRALFEAAGLPTTENLDALPGPAVSNLFGGRLVFDPPHPELTTIAWPGGQPFAGKALVTETPVASQSMFMTFPTPVYGFGVDLFDAFNGIVNTITVRVTTTSTTFDFLDVSGSEGYVGFIGATAEEKITGVEIAIDGSTSHFFVDYVTILDEPTSLSLSPNPIVVGLTSNQTASQVLTITNNTGADIPFSLSKRLDPGVGTPFLAPALSDATLAVVQETFDRFVPGTEYGEMPSSEPAGTPVQPQEMNAGLGDVLGVFNNFPMTNTGMTWANGTLYVVDYDDEQIFTYDPATETATFFATAPVNPQAIVWDGSFLWVGDCAGDQYAYDLAGTQVGSMSLPVRDCHATAFDGTDFLVCSDRTIDPVIYRVDHTGAVLGEYHTSHNGYLQSIIWVPEHAAGVGILVNAPGGGLWAYDNNNGWIARLTLVDGPDNVGTATLTSSFLGPVGGINGYSLAHDGTDMWWSHFNGTASVWQIDDGTDDIPWVRATPPTGVVPANSTFDVTLDFDSFRLPGGAYGTEIVVQNGGPDAVATTRLDVTGVPYIVFTPGLVAFSEGFVGGSETKQVMVSNRGGAPLDITSIVPPDPQFSVFPGTMQLGPGVSQSLYITYSASDPNLTSGVVQLSTNDPNLPTASVIVSGQNLGDPPTFTVDTPSINASLYSGASQTTTVEIQNTSSQTLDYEVDFIPAGFPGGSVPATASSRAERMGFYATGERTPIDLPYREPADIGEGPDRAPGDILATYGNISPTAAGLAWADDQLYVITNWEKTIKRYDLTAQQFTSSHPIHSGALTATWDGQNIWAGAANGTGPTSIIGYDENGQPVGSFNTPVSNGFVMVAFDGDAFIVAQAFLPSPTFYRVDYTGAVLDTWTSTLPALDDLEWVPGHGAAMPGDPTASLWVHEAGGLTLRQCSVSGGTVTEVQQFPSSAANFGFIAHDGVDMWLIEWFGLTLKKLDDGIGEFTWMSVPAAAGSIAGNSTGTFDVTLDPAGLSGTYPGDVRIRTNSTTQSEHRIPTSLAANPAPNLEIAPSSLDFGTVFVGLMPEDSVMVTNTGALPLDITDVTVSDPAFILDVTLPVTLAPGESDWGYVTFLPESSQVYTGTVSVTSNDPDDPVIDIPLTGTGLRAPDLEVSDLSVPATGWSGQGAFIEWTVQNAGLESTPAGGWQEAVYLSSDSNQVGTKISSFRPAVSLAPGQSYTHIHPLTFPHDIFGDYWITVRADELNEVAEFPSEMNDHRASMPTLITLTPFPDLVVDSLAVADTVETVLEFEVSWRTTNDGNATTSAPVWIDRVYLSSDSLPGGWSLGGFENLSYLPPASSYLQASRTVTIPSTVPEGTYWIVVHADQGAAVDERNNEGNNWLARQLYVKKGTFPQPDLEVTRIVTPPTGWSGNNVQVDWTVKNVGTATAGGSGPVDWVLLSPDSDPDPHVDLHIGGDYPGSALEPDSSYDRSISVPLPTDSSGAYYLWVWTDVDIVYDEPDIINNFSETKPIILTIPPPADLAVTSVFTSRNTVATGDTIKVSWTVQNQGAGPGFVSNWSDAVYLSLDATLDGSDIYLGKFYHTGFLEPGASYSDARMVTVPGATTPAGYQVLLVADADNQVPEGADISPNVGSWALNVTFPPDADLIASVQTIGGSLTSGTTASVTWRVDNAGPNPTTASSWVDSLYISPDSIVANATTIRVAGATHTGVLGAGTHYTETRSFTIPHGSSGRWFAFVKPDVAGAVYEMGNTGNNLAGAGFDVTLTPPPDLVFTNFAAAESLMVGTTHSVQWTVKNNGVGPASGSWTDRVYLSADQTVDGSDVLVKSAARAGTLAPGQFYQRDFDFVLPTVPESDYFLLGRTDFNNNVYEHTGEGNNGTSLPLHVSVPPLVLPDLVVDSFAYTSGLADSVHYSVRNLGPSNTGSSWWTDRVYLSTDNVLDTGTDPIIATASFVGNLMAGQAYSRSLKALLPNGTSGMFTIFTVTDASGQRAEVNENNNADTSQVNIILTPPDLVITSISDPDTLVSGQPVTVSWTVQNAGTGLPNTGTWYDRIYLSRDQLLDETDINLGSKRHNNGLGVGQSYNDSSGVTIPLGISGVHYLFVKTDNNNNVYEHNNELNNFALDPDGAVVKLPPLADLIVAAIAPPDTGITGDSLLVSWSVMNQSATVSGQWKDAVYLSGDSQWDIGDAFLGDASHSGGLPTGGMYTGVVAISAADFNLALETTVPGVNRGDYHVIVRTDIQNNIPETDEVNNAEASAATMNVDVEELVIQQTKSKGIGFAERHYFRVDVPAGWDTRLDFDVSTGDELDVFVRFGDVPDRVIFDQSASVSGAETVIVPAAGAGQLYIMVYGDFVPGGASFDIAADLIPFGLTGVGPATVGNSGFVSLRLTGGQLSSTTSAHMTLPGVGTIDAWRVDQVSSATVIASFDLTGVTPGDYDVKVVTATPDSSELFSAVEVISGGQADVWPNITAPDAARQLASIDYNVTLRNRGNVDAYDILAGVNITAGAEFRILLPGESGQFAVSNGGEILVHTDAIRVGETASFTVRLRAASDIEVEIVAVRTQPGAVSGLGGTRVVSSWVTDAADAFLARVAALGSPVDAVSFRSALYNEWSDPSALSSGGPASRRSDFKIEETFIDALIAIGATSAAPVAAMLASAAGDAVGPMLNLPPDNSGVTGEGLNAAKDETGQIYAAAKDSQGRRVKRGTKLRAARDPNEKVGPEETVVSQWQEIPYTVYFENVPTADAAAQQVFVLDQLDTDLDWRTFRLGEIAFSGEVITVPAGRSFWQTRVTLASGNVLEIDAGVDVVSGLARWTFTTIDPATGLPPTDPDAGFLPPNDENSVGEGHVFYTVRASETAPDGAEILNSADIVFDANDAITTNTVSNTLFKTYSDLATTSATGTGTGAVFLEGEPVEIRAVVRNIGANATTDFQVAFYEGSVSPANEIDVSYRIGELGVDDERDVDTQWTPDRVVGPQSVVIRADFADEVNETNEGNNDRVLTLNIAPREYTVDVVAGVNMLSLPLEGTDPMTARDYAALVGATTVIRWDTNGVFESFTPSVDPGDGFDIEAHAGYIVTATAAQSVMFSGVTNLTGVQLYKGLNVSSLPVDGGAPMSARTYTNLTRGTQVVRYNTTTSRFEPFIPTFHAGDGFVLRGGEAYISFADEANFVTFAGKGWLGGQAPQAPWLIAPGDPGSAAIALGKGKGASNKGTDEKEPKTAAVFTVTGRFFDQRWGSRTDAAGTFTVHVLNKRTGAELQFETDERATRYGAAFVSIDGASGTRAGDKLVLTVMNAKGRALGDPAEYVVNEKDMEQYFARIDSRVTATPMQSALLQNFPNPFNPVTTVRFQLAQAGDVRLSIYNVRGQLVKTLVNSKLQAGYYEHQWDGINDHGQRVSSGVYFYKLSAPGYSQARKMVLLK